MSEPSIRLAREGDLEVLADLWLAFMREMSRLDGHVRRTKRNRAVVRAHWGDLQRLGQLLVLADADDRAVGFSAVVANPPKLDVTYASATISDVFVLPKWRGKGWGRRLVAETVELIRRRGLHAVTLTVHEGNEAALGLYEALGFQALTRGMVLRFPD